MSFVVEVPQSVKTKAAIASGLNVDILRYEIYGASFDTDRLAYGFVEDLSVTPEGKRCFELNLNLVADQTYNMVFWAEVKGAGHYDTSNLKNVKINNYDDELSNDESRAAFFAKKTFSTASPVKETVVLYRPFAQLNFGTETYLSDLTSKGDIEVTGATVTVTNVATSFNTVTGEGEGSQTVIFQKAAIPSDPTQLTVKTGGVEKKYHYLAMNYLIVPENEANVNVDAVFTTNYGDVLVEVDNVTVKENFRTNIIGNLLVTGAELDIVVDDRFVDSATDVLNPDQNYDDKGNPLQ